MKAKVHILTLLLLVFSVKAGAQFYTSGSDSPAVKWFHFKTEHYDIIYPEGQDSLALVYARNLEKLEPRTKRQVPVILRNRLSYSNGMVVLPPLRMELHTVPDAYDPLPMPWQEHLILHEGQHLEQMLTIKDKAPWKQLHYLLGGLSDGAGVGVEAESALYEGDAVLAETVGSLSGRGRSADFLEYYRVSFGEGDMRNYFRWRYGSLNKYAPDYYRAGYVAMAGAPGRFVSLPGRRFRKAFAQSCDSLATFWKEDDAARAPFLKGERLVKTPKYYSEYKGLQYSFGSIYAMKSGLTDAGSIVRIDSLGEHRLATVSSNASRLRLSPDGYRIFWSEYVPDTRWEYLSYSDIFTLDEKCRRQRLTCGRRYYNPAVSPDGELLSVSSYSEDGRSSVVLLDSRDGSVVETIPAPDGMQIVETAWAQGKLYASAITVGGASIVEVGPFTHITPVEPAKIKDLSTRGDRICFASDRSGVNELYELNPEDGEVLQRSVTRYGASEFCFAPGRLIYSRPETGGRLPYALDLDSLVSRPVHSGELADWPLAGAAPRDRALDKAPAAEMQLVEPERYRQFPLLPHSWIPFYLSYDAVDALSNFDYAGSLGPGATAFFQNTLGNIYGSVAGRAIFDENNTWRGYGEINIVSTALYPVIEAKFGINDRNNLRYLLEINQNEGNISYGYDSAPHWNLHLRSYIPFNFSRGSRTANVVPSISLRVTNDILEFRGNTYNFFTSASASVRAYIGETTPASRIYPRWGAGAEIGAKLYPFAYSFVRPALYAGVYGYIPGFGRKDGFRLRAVGETSPESGLFAFPVANVVPRGFESSISSSVAAFRNKALLSVDYALPFAALDWSFLCPVAYIKNLEFNPHADLAIYRGSRSSGTLLSAGASLCLKLGNLLWLPFDTRIGLDYNLLSGSLLQYVETSNRHAISLVFTSSF